MHKHLNPALAAIAIALATAFFVAAPAPAGEHQGATRVSAS